MANDKRDRQKEGHRARIEAARAAEQRAHRNRNVFVAVFAVIAVLAFVVLIKAVVPDDETDVDTAASTSTTAATFTSGPAVFEYGTEKCPATTGQKQQLTFEDNFENCLDENKTYSATFDTTLGAVEVDLDTERTPGTVNNFVALTRYHYFDATDIFRLAPSIGIVQGGSPTNDGQEGAQGMPGYDLPDEGGDFDAAGTKGPFTYAAGDLVMARGQGRNSAAAEWFFGVNDKVESLGAQGTYVTFGHVTKGLDVLEKVLALAGEGGDAYDGPPTKQVTVKTITIHEKAG